MQQFTDQVGVTISLKGIPQRIVSLVPSQTELLFHLGLEAQVVGITRFCIHPETWFRTKTRVGGTKQVNLQTIQALQPDLVIANKEENVKEEVEAIARHFPVWTSDIHDLDTALAMIYAVGQITGTSEKARALVQQITTNFSGLAEAERKYKAVYLIWQRPYMAAGGNTFIDAMLARAGFENLMAEQPRYPELTPAALQQLDPELVLLSSEPFPFREKHRDEIKKLLPRSQVVLVDGEMFSWYGSRLLEVPGYFSSIRQQFQ